MSDRENADLFYRIRNAWVNRYPVRLFDILSSRYFWEDTFGKRVWRILRCRHEKATWVTDDRYWYCFRCQSTVPELKPPNNLKEVKGE